MTYKKQVNAGKYLCLALAALLGIALEVVLGLVIEPPIYGLPMNEWTIRQNISHWVLTCILWGMVGVILSKVSKSRYEFDIFGKAESIKGWQWIALAAIFIYDLLESYWQWNGSKVIREYYANGCLRFIFQYIYYVFEASLCMLTIVFSQKAFEMWFKNEKIPYGGIFLALTWGLSHIFMQGSVQLGLLTTIGGFLYGVVYLLGNKDLKKTYLLMLIIFIL